MKRNACVLLLLSVLAYGCGPASQPKPMPRPPEVLATAAVMETITDYEEFTGRTEAKNMVEVKARVTGYLDKVFFKDGDTVKEGEPLCQIDPRPYEVELQRANAALAQAEVKAKRAEVDMQRALVLRQSKAISPEDFDKIKSEKGIAEANIAVIRADRAKAMLNLEFTKIVVPTLDNDRKGKATTPATGRVGRRLKDPGNLIKADETLLTTIVTLDPMYIYFDIDERTVLTMRSLIEKKKIRSINEMTFHFELANDEGKFPYKGKIDFEDNQLDSGTGTLQLRGVFDNGRGFAPGQFVRLRLFVGTPRKAVLVPERALGTDQGQKFLYVVKKESGKDGNPVFTAEYRGGADLQLGAQRDGRRIIEKGVQEGEMVIWSGLQRVRKGAGITVKHQDPGGPPAK